MKTKFLLTLFLIIPVVGFILTKTGSEVKVTSVNPPPPPANNNIADSFLIGVMWDGLDCPLQLLDSLGINLWQHYSWQYDSDPHRHYPVGWKNPWTDCNIAPGDTLFAPSGDYFPAIKSKLNQVWNDNHMRTLFDRPKTTWASYGQRSDYQCEDVSSGDTWFYSFQSPNHVGRDTTDNSQYGNGVSVRHCYPAPESSPGGPGWVDTRLKANTEQCNSETFFPWTSDHECTWYIKPRIRIDSAYANNSQHWNTPVCSLKVIKQDGQTVLKNTVIKVRNFLNENDVYDGRYKEEFRYFSGDDTLKIQGAWGTDFGYSARGTDQGEQWHNNADIKVYYYGNCDAWFDYVRVDNDIANDLFKGVYDPWIQLEDSLACYNNSPLKFYIEWFEFNHIPCMTYVSKKLDSLENLICGKHITLMAGAYWSFPIHMPISMRSTVMTADYIMNNYIDKIQAKEIFGGLAGCYPFRCNFPRPGCNSHATCTAEECSKIPNTLNHSNPHIIATAVTPALYDTWLQRLLDTTCYYYLGNDWPSTGCFPSQVEGGYTFGMKLFSDISRQRDIPFIAWGQAHQHVTHGGDMQREPTNEELDLTANLPVAYGAKGIIYYGWNSWGNPDGTDSCDYGYGIVQPSGSSWAPRDTNVYGQPKWTKFKEIFKRLHKWGPTVMSFDNTLTHSYIYKLERNDLINNTYFADIMTDVPDPYNFDIPAETPDAQSNRYVQASVFRNSSDSRSKYFMIVNKRCSPYYNNSENGGRRYISIKFHANRSEFNGFRNWTITDLETGKKVITFDKTDSAWLPLKWYLPGQGKLYKISPTLIQGDTLVADESVSSVSFTCKDTVWNNGHNITIGNNTTISFTNTSKIIMNGGTFQMGEANDNNASSITSNAVSGNHWHGYDFNNCTVKVYNSHFQNLANDTSHALNLINCSYVDIRDNTFSFENDALKGGVNITYFNSSIGYQIQNLYIGYNRFNSNNSTVPLLSVMSYAGLTTPALIEHNTFTTSNTAGSTAIMLNEIVGGAIKSNVIANFELSINALASSIDIYGNLISSVVANSVGINGLAGSELKLNPTNGMYLGGMNNIGNTGTSNKNINVNNSYFLLDGGKNVFNIVENVSSYHLRGYFPQNNNISSYETQNCFKLSGNQTQNPVNNVTNGAGGSQIVFEFSPFNCDNDSSCFAGDLGVGDTVWAECGSGGAFSSAVIVTPKTIHDSLCLEMRKRNYTAAITKAMALLNLFPDSLLSLDAVSKLYLAKTKTDTSTASNTALKTFYETLILNHSDNAPLVKRCNYFVQKCKVLLRQYSSAMSGFQQIMEQNPYSYDALVAHWDYMATQLILQGSGGGESSDYENDSDSLIDGRKSSPFTKEQRRQIGETITNVYNETNTQEEKKIEILKKLSKEGDIKAEKELAEKNALKDAVKPLHPKNILEHINIVNGDIQKLFAVNKSSGSNENQSLIPDKFSLGQNYPNPFNPITKIKYGLPRDVKVVIKIYDILGREVKTLVNEFKKAGYYEINFDGANLATGVYFYRIEAGEFVQSKKMVLIK